MLGRRRGATDGPPTDTSSKLMVKVLAPLSPISTRPTGVVPVLATQPLTILIAVAVQVPRPGRSDRAAQLDAVPPGPQCHPRALLEPP